MKKYYLILISLLSGVLLSLSWPAHGFAALLFVGFVPLLFVEDFIFSHKNLFSRRSIFFYSFIAFLCWNSLDAWWVYNSTEIGGIFAQLFNGILMAFTFTLYHFIHRTFNGIKGYIGLLACWVTFEYFHLNWDLTWPWMNLGNGLATQPTWIQWYEYTGTFGGTIWILLANILLFSTIKEFMKPERNVNTIRILSIVSVCTIAFPILISKIIYASYSEEGKAVEIVVVQPNIDPWNEKFSTMSMDQQLSKMIKIGKEKLSPSTSFLVFPETALPEGMWEDEIVLSDSYKSLKELISTHPNLKIIIGASTYKLYKPNEKLSETARKYPNNMGWYDAYNAALFVDSSNGIQLYHKSKLVPGVEKMPYPKYLGFLEQYSINLGGMNGSYGVQTNRTPFDPPADHIKVAPVICYESIYGEYVAEYVSNGAQFIFIITNDGWWGNTPGYRQHFCYASLRAIETRRSIARSANTGISGFINQKGEVIEKSNWWEPIALKQTILANTTLTFYVKHGDYLARFFMWVTVVLLVSTIFMKVFKKH